jgi:ATP-dependent DNA ligase
MEAWLSPMLCQKISDVPADADAYVLEPKMDGWRFVMWNTGRGVKAFGGRNGADYSGKLPYVEDVIARLPADTAVDGEILGGEWGDVQGVMTRGKGPHVPSETNPALTYVVFDVLRISGTDVRDLPWVERRRLLEAGVPPGPIVGLSSYFPASPRAHQIAVETGFEGSVVKLKTSAYVNSRSSAWLKIKPQDSCEGLITGFKPGQGAFAGLVGAVEFQMLAEGAPAGRDVPDVGPDGKPIVSRCSGMNMKVRKDMTENPSKYLGEVIEVKHMGIGSSGKPRHPQFSRLRSDRTVAPVSISPRPKRTPSGLASSSKRSPTGGWVRNYGAMKDAKLLSVISELEKRIGDATLRVAQNKGDMDLNLAKAKAVARGRGLIP